jgi:geranylgeranyl reductase family protein
MASVEKASGVYDAIIVGGGPGGATAAYFLGEAGRRVLVLEKATLPRYKPCGGGLSPFVLRHFPFPFEPVIESTVSAISYAFRGRTVTVPVRGQDVCLVMRDRFDAHILAHARAEVRTGAAVRSVRELADRVIVEAQEGQAFTGRYLIGADGANSVVARGAGLHGGRIRAAAIEVEVPVPPPVLRRFAEMPLFVFGAIPMGYLWVFPKAAHLSVGIGALRPQPGQLQATLARVMRRYGIVLNGAPLHGHPIPIRSPGAPLASACTLLVGDAAGLADPLTGEGIRPAIISGRLAAQAILAGRPDRYAAMVRRSFGRSHALGRMLALLFYRHPRASFALGVRNPAATRAFVDLIAGRTGYPGLILRLLGTLPAHMAAQVFGSLRPA